jgi:hypothetical protein
VAAYASDHDGKGIGGARAFTDMVEDFVVGVDPVHFSARSTGGSPQRHVPEQHQVSHQPFRSDSAAV